MLHCTAQLQAEGFECNLKPLKTRDFTALEVFTFADAWIVEGFVEKSERRGKYCKARHC